MRSTAIALMLLAACQGPKGDPGPMGAMGAAGISPAGSLDLATAANADLAGFIAPQAITCLPGKSFCISGSQVGTCTLSGADAVIGEDCTAAGSPTNSAACVTTGCPNGQAACCRRQRPIWKWNFTQPALVGESYVGYEANKPYLGVSLGCTGVKNAYASLFNFTNACPPQNQQISVTMIRGAALFGSAIPLSVTTDMGVTDSANASLSYSGCSQWNGTVTWNSDLPDWSVSINATCRQTGTVNGIQVIGTMSGSE